MENEQEAVSKKPRPDQMDQNFEEPSNGIVKGELEKKVADLKKSWRDQMDQNFEERLIGIVKAELEKKNVAALEKELNEIKKVTKENFEFFTDWMVVHACVVDSTKEDIKTLKSRSVDLDECELMPPLTDHDNPVTEIQGRPQAPSALVDEAEPSDQHASSVDEKSEHPVLCEIFTTHYSTCMAGLESELAKIQQDHPCQAIGCNVPVIVLANHVFTYRDTPGQGCVMLSDPFSSLTLTRRQEQYAGRMGHKVIENLPHLIIQGRVSTPLRTQEDFRAVKDLLQDVPRSPRLLVVAFRCRHEIFQRFNGSSRQDELHLSFILQLNAAEDVIPKWEIMVGLYEIKLAIPNEVASTHDEAWRTPDEITTNSAVSTPSSYFVVRDLTEADDRTHTWGPRYRLPIRGLFYLWEGFDIDNCGIVVFLQCPISMHIRGIANIQLSSDNCQVVQVVQW